MLNLKNIIKILFFCSLFLSFASCEGEKKQNLAFDFKDDSVAQIWRIDKQELNGNALGTTLIVKTSDESLKTTPYEIDSILTAFNNELSTYLSTSLISGFNQGAEKIDLNTTHYFKDCFELSQEIYEITEGAFDPTVYPLVELWGFFKEVDHLPTTQEIDSVLAFVGFEKDELYTYNNGVLEKKDKRFQLVFNAIAKGQAVDVLATYLQNKKQENFYVEIGGEIYVQGKNSQGENWIVGIDIPMEENTGTEGWQNRKLENMLQISNKGMATSGNYRDFYERDGVKYSHTIHPKTGKPIRQKILSATVIANSTAVADAYATAFMVMGVEKSLELIKNNSELEIEAYLLYEEKGEIYRAYSEKMKDYFKE